MIDELRVGDEVAASALSAAFGWPHRAADWALFLRLGRGIAWRDGGRLGGTAMWFPLGPDHASIGLVQVAPELQGRGIGKRLMRGVMDAAAPRGLTLHATKEGAGLYAALGFSPRGIVQQWQGVCANGNGKTLKPAALEDVLRLDRAGTGLLRGDLIEVLFADAAATVAGPDGYAMRRVFGRGSVIGPVIAQDARTAHDLIRAFVVPGLVRVDVPAEKSAILDGFGLACVDKVQEMALGNWPIAPHKFALAAQALG